MILFLYEYDEDFLLKIDKKEVQNKFEYELKKTKIKHYSLEIIKKEECLDIIVETKLLKKIKFIAYIEMKEEWMMKTKTFSLITIINLINISFLILCFDNISLMILLLVVSIITNYFCYVKIKKVLLK